MSDVFKISNNPSADFIAIQEFLSSDNQLDEESMKLFNHLLTAKVRQGIYDNYLSRIVIQLDEAKKRHEGDEDYKRLQKDVKAYKSRISKLKKADAHDNDREIAVLQVDLERASDQIKSKKPELEKEYKRFWHDMLGDDLWGHTAFILFYQSKLNAKIGANPYMPQVKDEILLNYIFEAFHNAMQSKMYDEKKNYFEKYEDVYEEEFKDELSNGPEFKYYFMDKTFERFQELFPAPRTMPTPQFSVDQVVNQCFAFNRSRYPANTAVTSFDKLQLCLGITAKDLMKKGKKILPRNKNELFIFCICAGSGFTNYLRLKEALTYYYLDSTLLAENDLSLRDSLIQSTIRNYDNIAGVVRKEYEVSRGKELSAVDPDGITVPYRIFCRLDRALLQSKEAQITTNSELFNRFREGLNECRNNEQIMQFMFSEFGSETLLHSYLYEFKKLLYKDKFINYAEKCFLISSGIYIEEETDNKKPINITEKQAGKILSILQNYQKTVKEFQENVWEQKIFKFE